METVTTRKGQKEATRKGLIGVATRLFSEKGIRQTSTADVAKALKVSHGTLFVHFPTRDDLVLAVMDSFGDELSQAFGSGIAASDFKGLLKAHLKTLANFEDFYFRLLSEGTELPGKVRSVIFMLNSAVSCKMFEVAKPLMKKGELKKLDRSVLFNAWISIVNHYVLNRDLFSNRTPILKEKGEELVQNFMLFVKP